MKHDIILPVGGNQVVHDESQFSGTAFSVSYPETLQDVSDIVRTCAQSGESITVHGSLTALNGAGVPLYGHCMDMQRLSQVTYDPQDQTVWAQAGASFQSIEQTVRRESHMTREFPASPTEKTATLGGGLSFHTAGLRSFRYGSVADHVLELEYCNNKGEIRRLARGQDGFDLFLGSEGMCGVITGARLSTVPLLPHVWGLIFFFDNDDTAMDFASRAEGLDCVSVLEYMDSACFRLADEYRDSLSALSGLPSAPDHHAAIYLELESDQEESIEQAAEELLCAAEELGADPDKTWSASGDEVEQFRGLHHAITECVNMKIAQYHAEDSRVKRLAYPIRLTGEGRKAALQYYRHALADSGLDYLIFGHLCCRQVLTLNILSRSAQDYLRGKDLFTAWCAQDKKEGRYSMHRCGVGKLYRSLFCSTAPLDVLNKRIKSKQRFDPENRFNPGNMFTQTTL